MMKLTIWYTTINFLPYVSNKIVGKVYLELDSQCKVVKSTEFEKALTAGMVYRVKMLGYLVECR